MPGIAVAHGTNRKGHVLNALLLAVGVGLIVDGANDPGWTLVLDEFVLNVLEVATPVVLGALYTDVDTAFDEHRTTLHKLPVLVFFVVFPIVFGTLQYVRIGILTRYVLDVVGSRRGTALFSPYSEEFGWPTGVTTSSDEATTLTLPITGVELAAVWGFIYLEFTADDLAPVVDAIPRSAPRSGGDGQYNPVQNSTIQFGSVHPLVTSAVDGYRSPAPLSSGRYGSVRQQYQ